MAVDCDLFMNWDEASRYVGEEKLLRELSSLYFNFSGFASVEVSARSFERVYVDGYFRLYPSDIEDLKKGMTISYSSALIDQNISINGVCREDFFQKFLVFDDELQIGRALQDGENSFKFPRDIHFNQQDLDRFCESIGLKPGEPLGQKGGGAVLLAVDPEEELGKLKLIGVLACMLAMNNDLDGSLQDGQHISEIIIDDLFTMMSGLGIDMDGRKKFLYERLISSGVKSVLED
ncbi:MAG: hypothetical protein P8101_04370 [Candidatus Thiodiazotropha sp.]|jgi:hypothetical protein